MSYSLWRYGLQFILLILKPNYHPTIASLTQQLCNHSFALLHDCAVVYCTTSDWSMTYCPLAYSTVNRSTGCYTSQHIWTIVLQAYHLLHNTLFYNQPTNCCSTTCCSKKLFDKYILLHSIVLWLITQQALLRQPINKNAIMFYRKISQSCILR